jgi:small-conductance mechanosensitive channel
MSNDVFFGVSFPALLHGELWCSEKGIQCKSPHKCYASHLIVHCRELRIIGFREGDAMSHGRVILSRLFAFALALALIFGAGLVFSQSPKATMPFQTNAQNGVPVVVNGKTLFFVESRILSFSPEDRAAAIAKRIKKLYNAPPALLNAIRVDEFETTSEIMAGDLIIMAVTEEDAHSVGRARQEVAQEYAGIIRTTVAEIGKQHSTKALMTGVLWSFLSTGILFLAFKLFQIAFLKLFRKLELWRGTRIRSFRIQRLELLTADRITDALTALAKIARIVVGLILLYFYLPLVLSFFPGTRGWAAILFNYVMRPVTVIWEAIANNLPDFFFVGVILVVAYYGIKLVKFAFAEITKGTIEIPGFYRDWAEPTYKIARFLLIAFTAVVVFPYLPGSKSPAFQGVSIFLGVLFSLGSTSAVANIVAGMLLTYTRAFQDGDRVRIGETTGDVLGKTLLVTRIRTIKNEDISIPNALVLSSHIINYSSSALEHGLILHTGVTIGYDAPWRQVHELLISAACDTERILSEPKPFVLQTSLDDFYVSYELNAFTNQPRYMASIYSDLHQNIQDRFNKAGVEIMSPHYGSIRDGNSIAIPAEDVPRGYKAPPFRILSLDNPFPRKRNGPETKAD